MEDQETNWVTRWKYEIDPNRAAPGVWRLRDGGFLVRSKYGMKALRDVAVLADAILLRSQLVPPDDDEPLLSSELEVAKSPSFIGDCSEWIVATKLLVAGYEVSKTLANTYRYDLVVRRPPNGKTRRVQVKTARSGTNEIIANAYSVNYRSRGSSEAHSHTTYAGQIEDFALYHRETDAVFIVPVEDVRGTMIHLKLPPYSWKKTKGVLRAKDYRLEQVMRLERTAPSLATRSSTTELHLQETVVPLAKAVD